GSRPGRRTRGPAYPTCRRCTPTTRCRPAPCCSSPERSPTTPQDCSPTDEDPMKLVLDQPTVRRARSLARKAGRPIVDLARTHTTVSVERATLRLAGIE